MIKWNIYIIVVSFIGLVCAQYEGQLCKIDADQSRGVCKTVGACPLVMQAINQNRRYTRCGSFQGTQEIVCCPENVASPISTGISAQKCAEYVSAVYEYVSSISLAIDASATQGRVDRCGQKQIPLIVGGELAGTKEFPHMALIGFDNNGQIQWACGGSLISDQFVLTAAHCAQTSPYGAAKYVRLGDLNYLSTTDDAHAKTVNVAQIFIHKDYQYGSNYNDIAVFKLDQKIVLNPYIKPACLPTSFDVPETQAIATGWGDQQYFGDGSNDLRKVTLEKFTLQECNSSYATSPNVRLGIIDDIQICAGSKHGAKDTCQGDSGGPLQVFHPTQYCMYTIIGITSFGMGCGYEGIPGVYTRVYPYLNWIEQLVWGV